MIAVSTKSLASTLPRAVLTLGCAPQLWGCSEHEPPVLSPAGPVALATRDLLFTATGLMLIVVLPVFVLTAFVVWRYRASNAAAYTPDWGFSWPIDIAIWAVPLSIVAVLGFLVWNKTHQLDPYDPVPAPGDPLVVQVVALDWKWLFIYPEQDIASVNRLVFPAGRSLTLKLTSDTVMNAFVVPALGGQIYAMAGMQTQLNLLANEPGAYDGHNTQFSGTGFPQDRFVAEAVAPQDFHAFVSTARGQAQGLTDKVYRDLAQPSLGAPEQQFGHVAPNLFQSIIAKYTGHVERQRDAVAEP